MRWKTAFVLLLIVVLLALLGYAILSDTARPLTMADLHVGMCLDERAGETVVVPCLAPHYYEIFALIPYPAGENEPYPGGDWLYAYAEDRCHSPFKAYTGRDPGTSALHISISVPDAQRWAAGQRETACQLFRPSAGSPLRQRILGSRAGRSAAATAQPSPTPTGPRAAALAGNWTARDRATGTLFLLQFRVEGTDNTFVVVYHGGSYGPGGHYQWLDDSTIRLTFDSGPYVDTGDGYCERLPTFLQSRCHTTLYNPPAYPEPAQPAAPYPVTMVTSRLNAPFTVTLGPDTLTLTGPSGDTHRFQRLDD